MNDLLAWLAPHSGDEPSFVQAAVANFGRVLADLSLVLHYEMDAREGHYWVSKWYRLYHGKAGYEHEVEQWGVHVSLIHNLIIELTRATNLVIQRSRQADDTVLLGSGLAVIDTGPPHALMEAVEYSAAEAQAPQPYPGPTGFPAVIPSRDVGGLGFRRDDTPRTLEEFEEWIARLIRDQGPGSDPPPKGNPPFALPRHESEQAPNIEHSGGKLPGSLIAPYTVVLALGAVGAVFAYPWLLGAAIGAATIAALLNRRIWRWPPERTAALVLVATAVAGGLIAELITVDHGNRRFAGTGSTSSVAVPRTSTAATSIPRRSGAGQIEGGDIFRAAAGKAATFTDPVLALAGQEVMFGYRVSNPGPDNLVDVKLRVTLPTTADTSASVVGVARSPSANPTSTAATVTVNFARQRSACLRYEAGSTRLLDANGGLLRRLPDGVTQGGIGIGSVGVPLTQIRFLMLSAHAVATPIGVRCA